MTSLANLRVFATYPHSCSYLPEERATTLFIDPNAPVNQTLYSELSSIGFRRSGPHVYRPHCGSCQACIPARIPVEIFKPNRTQRRLWRRNADIDVREIDQLDDERCYQLYCRYIEDRHGDGDMFPPDRAQYDTFLTREWGCTRYYGFYLHERLLAVTVLDQLDNGTSAIYTFFEPEEKRRSLGSYAILWEIELTKKLGLPSLFLGYWIRRCRKMNYKVDFRPVELFQDGRWNLYR